MSRRRIPLLAAAAAACVTVPLSAASADALRLTRVVGGLSDPVGVVAAPGSSRLFVVEQGGLVRVVAGHRLLPRPFLDLRARVSTGGERGLLGLAFDPGYATNGRLYVDYTNRAGDTRVVEFRRRGPDAADPASARVILRVRQPYPNHNGGELQFGPDGDLYVGLGDGGGAGDPHGNGQRLDTLLGKILRIDVHGSRRPYVIPPGNPFRGRRGSRPEIWFLGLRNPWRFSFDRATGDMYIGDVGQDRYEEIDRAPRGVGGLNFGWSTREGRHPFPGGSRPSGPLTGPVVEYSHAFGCSVIGGYVYRGRDIPSLRGRYVYADYCSGRFWTIRAGAHPGPPREITAALGRAVANPTSFGEDARGELYVVGSGALYRFSR